jgi:hypothetical protein
MHDLGKPSGEVRPDEIIRKNSYGNRSEAGAGALAVLMTIFRTLTQRGHQPLHSWLPLQDRNGL